jgi:hypothetical protein
MVFITALSGSQNIPPALPEVAESPFCWNDGIMEKWVCFHRFLSEFNTRSSSPANRRDSNIPEYYKLTS